MKTIKQDLINKINQKEIVIFVGAGLSINAGIPNWNGLVETILDGISSKEPKSEKFKSALIDEVLTPIEVLQKISDYRDDAIAIVEKTLRSYDSCTPLRVHHQIGQLSSNLITTNYDNLIEKALPSFEVIPYSNKYKVANLSHYESYIFKIHGDIQEPDKFVLFSKEYEKLYSDGEKSSTFELKKIISDKSILFIGFGMTDPYISFVFEFIEKLYSGFNPEHYIITTDTGRQWPKKINPLFIEDYGELEPFLDTLIAERKNAVETQVEIKKDIESKSDLNILSISSANDYDSPPVNKFWVGREKELKSIDTSFFKIVFITGIGGQGKSALASHYIRNYFDTETYEFADWRDFKEEANRFQTKLISIIKRLEPEIKINFESLNNNDLVDTFFHVLGERKIIFVFDNIDNYIDLVSFVPSGSFGYFYEQIVSRNHKSRFIFTCRPFIREATIDFYQIKLTGISESECVSLFKHYQIGVGKDSLENLAHRAHKLTKGHPLWLNLIAGQAVRGINTVNEFMTEIEGKTTFKEDNFSSILSEKILTAVWQTLNDKQKNVIRGIAETVRPETEENLKVILDSEIKPNQFHRSIRTLKNLHLIETLKDGEIELHPLVKEFVLTKYPKTERVRFITLFVKYYDQFIYILKPRLNSKLSLQEFQNWTLKIELQINQGDLKPALVALEEVSYSILSAGYSEEYARVAHRLFDSLNWEAAISDEYPYFHSQLNRLTSNLTQMGNFSEAEILLEKYKKLIPGKSVHYLAYCSEKVYSYWYQGRFSEAIEMGEEGVALLEESSLADSYSLRHNLALAHRDSKVNESVHKALHYFSNGQNIDSLVEHQLIKEFGGAYYGNIGKCLEYLGEREKALVFYYYSLKLLMNEDHINTILNVGYACLWIASILSDNSDEENALYFLRYGKISWDKTSPPRSSELTKRWNEIQSKDSLKSRIESFSEWKIQNHCSNHIASKIV
ncbi:MULTISPECIES: SIR2 family protein [unclassified Flavobacterium]|uniref:SIR2 family protein n=1 Tax=unclassified Flavobacterium TaxID=196869 RepID=UPI001F13F4FF|nr:MULTISPECIES: SIR2 family protein [unclassified Flavobacterium]UMY65382.1 SIR2 family protein [Flavobacterium sp. HJ-32-4]